MINAFLSRKILLPVLLLPVWYLIYHNLQPVTDWLVDKVLGMTQGTRLTESIRFFIFELPKVLQLLYGTRFRFFLICYRLHR